MPESVRRYTTVVALLGAGALIFSLTRVPGDIGGLAALTLLAIIAEWARVELLPGSRSNVSLTSVVALAAMLLFGIAGGALVYAVGGLVTTFMTNDSGASERASLLRRAAFNTGMYVCAITAAAAVFQRLGGGRVTLTSLAVALPLVAAVTTDHLVNVGLLVGVIARQQGTATLEIWREHFAWTVPIAIGGAAVGSLAIAVSYQSFGLPGLAVFAMPLLLIRYAYWLYVHQTRKIGTLLRNANAELVQSVNTLSASRRHLAEIAGGGNGGDLPSEVAHRATGLEAVLAVEGSRLERLHRRFSETIAGT